MARKNKYAEMFTLRKDGRYVATYSDETGRHSLYDRDPEVLFHKLQVARGEITEVVTFKDVAEQWERKHREEIEYRTWNNYIPHYRSILAQHGSTPIDQVTAQDVIRHLHMAKAQGYSATVVNTIRSLYSMVFDHAVADGVIQYNPVLSVKLPKGLQRGKRIAPTKEQITTILSSVDVPFGLFPYLLLCTGLRKSEALALTWADVDFKRREIRVTKSLSYPSGNEPVVKSPKTEAGNRVVPIIDILVEPLQEAKRGSASPYVFPAAWSNRSGTAGGMMHRRGYDGAWQRYCEAVGLVGADGKPTITAHNLRHGTATIMKNSGVDPHTAQKILGHSRVSTTMEIYTHLTDEQQVKAVGQFNSGLSLLSNCCQKSENTA